jgi:hypothetical protein
MSPQQPTVSDYPTQDTVQPLANGGIQITTIQSADYPLHMEWILDPSMFPKGANVTSVDARICGIGSGGFYEEYGPYGAQPVEYEVKPPGPDGCWHFVGAGSDYTMQIYAYGNASLNINSVVFAVTFDH